jgi:hypothetical protein
MKRVNYNKVIENTWEKLISASLEKREQRILKIHLEIEVQGDIWRVYEAVVSYRDILFFCDKGSATYLVDTYGARNTVELFDWERS